MKIFQFIQKEGNETSLQVYASAHPEVQRSQLYGPASFVPIAAQQLYASETIRMEER